MKNKITPKVIVRIKRLYEAGFNSTEIAEVLDLGESTVAKVKSCDYDYETYRNYGKEATSESEVRYSTNEDRLDTIIRNQKLIINLLENSKVEVKQQRPETEYNKFVRAEFKKNPEATMKKVAKKWKARKRAPWK